MRNTLCTLGLAAAWLAPLPSWAQQTLALDQALQQALEQATQGHPTLAAAARQVQAQDAAVQQARTWRNPEFSAQQEGTRSDLRTTTLTLTMPLEWGGKRDSRVQAAERAVDLARADLTVRQAEVRAHVTAAYFQALVAQERVQLAQASTELARQAASAAAKRVAAGKVSPVDLTRARVDEANAELELSEAQGAWRTAQQTLALSMGERNPSFTALSAAGPSRAPMPGRPACTALLSAPDTFPAVARARQEAAHREALVTLERSQRLPDLTLTVGSKREANGSAQPVLGLSVPLPVFDRQQGRITEAMRRAEQAHEELEATRLQALNELQTACTALEVAQAQMQRLETVVLPSAQQAREDASKGFDAGKFSFLDVLDAQRALLQARTRYLNTLAAAHQAAADIDRITGR